jgi:4-hydroxyphenylpyruvate dioxygenase
LKTSIATVSLPGTLRDKLPVIAAAGFDGIEVFEQDFIADAGTPAEVGAMIRDHGLAITLFQPFRDFEGLTGDLRVRAVDRAEHKFDLMGELGVDLVLVCSSVHPASLGGIDRAAADFHELGERAARRGLRVGYEALAWGRHIHDHRDAWEVVRRADHPAVGLILDSFHTQARQVPLDSVRAIPGDRIFFVQLADAPAIPMDLLYWSRHFRCMPGEGDLDVTGFTAAVLATGYDGPLSLEIFNDQFRGGNARLLADDGHRSIVNLLDRVRRAEPGLPSPLPPFPGPVRPEGVAWIEFATARSDARALTGMLKTLGFAHSGDHVQKRVTLWQQGDARIVVNTEDAGFARTSWVVHGTGICEIGLRVPDAEAALTRAIALGAEPLSAIPGAAEMAIPAVRTAGGAALRFMGRGAVEQAVWAGEFRARVGAPTRGAGITGIDHLALTLAYDEMLSWSLFHSAILDLDKAPMLDVIDPDGLVRSQALSTPGGALRLTLNGADSRRTLAGGFLAESFGGAVQHVAFSTNDIFATVTTLANTGFQSLPMPWNYYADLAARFGLPPEELARLSSLNILYDEDGHGGRFWQVYSQPFAGGMFFEIVQRAGGYDGYGAANAPLPIWPRPFPWL